VFTHKNKIVDFGVSFGLHARTWHGLHARAWHEREGGRVDADALAWWCPTVGQNEDAKRWC